MGLMSSAALSGWSLDEAMGHIGFLDASVVAFVLFDVDGAVVDANERARLVFGLDLGGPAKQRLFGPEWEPEGTGGTLEMFGQPHQETVRDGRTRQGVSLSLTTADRRRRRFHVNAYPVVVGGSIQGVVCSFMDRTEALIRETSLTAVGDVGRFAMQSNDIDDVQRHLCRYLVDEMGYALAWIGLGLPDADARVESTFAAGRTDYVKTGMVSWSGSKANGLGPAGTCLRTRRVQVVDDLTTQALYEPWRERARDFGLYSSVAIPFSPLGQRACLSVYSGGVGTFVPALVEGLEALVREVEAGLAHIQSRTQLSLALDGTLAALSRLTETRDPYTAGHQSKVGDLASAIAAHMGMDETTVGLIHRAGEVHDVGKMMIAPEILTKPGRLTELEFRLVQRHTEFGADVLAQAHLPWPIAEVALQHHERLNGSGYPLGLTGSEIILPARIVAVADAVEAMTSHRPYRELRSIEAALDEVHQMAGDLYDAEVVRHCIGIFEAGFSFASPSAPMERSSAPWAPDEPSSEVDGRTLERG